MGRTAEVGDIYAIKSRKLGKWCLYQFTKDEGGDMALLTLDWFSDDLPTEKQLKKLNPLKHLYGIDHCSIDTKKVPKRFTYVGNVPPILTSQTDMETDWPRHFFRAEWNFIWQQYPKKERERFIEASYSNELIEINGHQRREALKHIQARELEGITDWKELDKQRALQEINYEGNDPNIISYIATRKLITKLYWQKHGQGSIDISQTNLLEVKLDITGLKEITLNPVIDELWLMGDNSYLKTLKINHPHSGKGLMLSLENIGNLPVPDFGLPALEELRFSNVTNIDLQSVINHYPNITRMRVWGAPGHVENVNALKQLKNLTDLQFNDLFGYQGKDFPATEELPGIEVLWLSSAPQEAGKAIKSRFKQVEDLKVRQLRGDDWIEANVNNPFMSWSGREGIQEKHAKAATNAYKKTSTALNKLSGKNISDDSLEPVLKEFVEAFNKINRQSSIETIEREEIARVYFDLLKKLEVKNLTTYEKWLDQWREF